MTGLKNKKRILKTLKGARGIERAAFFKNGGTLTDWMGGPHLVVTSKKKKNNERFLH